MQSQTGNLVVRDVPYGLWIFGILFAGVGTYIGFTTDAPVFFPLLFGSIGLGIVLFIPILTITVDRHSGILTLQRTGILRRSADEIRLDQIEDIFVNRKVSTSSDGSSTTYQVLILLEDGKRVALRNYSSSGRKSKEKRAQQLREAIGLDAQAELNRKDGVYLERSAQSRAAQQTPTPHPTTEQVTDGVHWEVQQRSFSSAPVTRWFSPDVETPGYFVYIAQKQEGQGEQKGLMNLFGKTLFKQSLKIYGFDESFTPGLDNAEIHQQADKRLQQEYFIFTSSTRDAHRVLNPWVVTPLIAWADRHPLDLPDRQYSQMTVLFSPWGLYISVLGSLSPQELDEITTLGVELVKSSTT